MTESIPLRRVLMTGDTVGGVWTFTLELAEALGAYSIEVLLAAMGGQPSSAQWEDAARIPNLQVIASDYKLEWMEDPWKDVEATVAWLADLESRFAPDVIHCNTYGHGTAEFRAPVILTAHSCVLSWWRAVRREPAPASWNPYLAAVLRAIESASVVTAPSQWMLQSFEDNYGPLPGGRVIANGRSAGRFRSLRKDSVILSAGRLWDEAKNISLLAGIAERLPWPVYVAGAPCHPAGRSAELGGCRPLGQLSPLELAEWYGHAGIYALPARYEPFGLSALEAALAGCALVLSDIPSLRETWQGTAVFVPTDDAEGWVRELRSIAEDAQRRIQLGALARRRALEFTAQKMAGEYLSCYSQAVRHLENACAS